MVLIPGDIMQFKANLHCHSTRSDGRLTPSQLKEAYQREGYQILAITDHESPFDHSALNEENFLMLTGYEAYIRPNKHCAYDVFASEIHMNLFAKDPRNVTLIGYDPPCCKYLTAEEQQALPKASPTGTRAYTTAYINEFIRSATDNGYLVSYNHPVWSMESHERILSYEGIFSMEMINGNSDCKNHMEYNGPLYDTLLRNGKRWFIHGGDDNHNKAPFGDPACDSFRAATMICAPRLTYADVMAAMEHGAMYATEGPRIHAMSYENGTLSVSCSQAAYVTCHIGSKSPPTVYAPNGDTLTHASFTVHPDARYIRVTVVDHNGKRADTRAYFPEEYTK